MSISKFREKQFRCEILQEVNELLLDKEKRAQKSYDAVGKESNQARDWRTNELLWEDDEKTVPYFRDKYEWVPKAELTEEDQMQLAVIAELRAELEALV